MSSTILSVEAVAQMEMEGVYLLHFEPRYEHAGHYLGWAKDVGRRYREHTSGSSAGANLVRVAVEAGCDVSLARVWRFADRHFERRLKRQGGLSRHCPICRASGDYHR